MAFTTGFIGNCSGFKGHWAWIREDSFDPRPLSISLILLSHIGLETAKLHSHPAVVGLGFITPPDLSFPSDDQLCCLSLIQKRQAQLLCVSFSSRSQKYTGTPNYGIQIWMISALCIRIQAGESSRWSVSRKHDNICVIDSSWYSLHIPLKANTNLSVHSNVYISLSV